VLRRDRRLRSLFAPQGEMGAGVSDFPLRPRGRRTAPYRAKIVPVIQANAGKPDFTLTIIAERLFSRHAVAENALYDPSPSTSGRCLWAGIRAA
jgi:hypothetical protein